jgi:eukaryotic-like serine/threonine-protein kinase
VSNAHLFGKYRLLGILASGGMARLYLAVMTGIDGFSRVVALKQVLPHLAESREFINMFLNEARLAAKLDHPNIVRIYELGEIDGQYFISMEYLPGEDLTKIVNKSRKKKQWIPVNVAAAIVQATADALQCAHDLGDETGKPLGLVHRDVSLSNVIVTYHGLPKLADFGIAKATAIPSVATRAGTFKGKFAYSAPEQVTAKEVDARTDVFALGIVLWELLTIRRLFKRESDAATIRAVEEAEVPAVSSIRSDVPKEIDRITLKALAKKPKDRFQSANEMSDALEEVLVKLGSQSPAKLLSKWLASLFGEETANTKKSVAQGRLDLNGDPDLPLPAPQAALIGLSPVPNKRRGASQVSGGAPPSRSDPQPKTSLPASSGSQTRPAIHQPPPSPASSRSSSHSNSGSLPSLPRQSSAATELRPPPERPRSSVTSAGPRSAWSTEFSVDMPAKTPSKAQPVLNFDAGSMPIFSSGSSLSAADAPLPLQGEKNSKKMIVVLLSLVATLAGVVAIIVLSLDSGAPRGPIGVVKFEQVPQGATVFVDNQRVPAGEAIQIPIGSRSVRVEVGGKVVTERTISVQPGDQTIQLER